MSKKLPPKTRYFYIDESGGILNNSPAFILGCTRTDTPALLNQKITGLLKSFEDKGYFAFMLEQIRTQGFHAVDNHPDVRTMFFSMLPFLNFRSFFCILNKSKPAIKTHIDKKEEKELYLLALDKLLRGRFNNRHASNEFFFEELQFSQTSQQNILDSYFAPYMKDGNISYRIVGKEEVNLATTDYMNYIFHLLLLAKDLTKVQRMVDNLELVKPKIAFINFLHTDTFLTRRDAYDAAKIVDLYNR
jgi:hypothetical protein